MRAGTHFGLKHSGGAPSMILQSLAGLPAFLVYFCTAIVAVVAYLLVYTRVTPHDEFQLIRDNEPAAAIALGLSLLGFVLPVVSAIVHSANVGDCLVWSVIALIVQIVGLLRGQDTGAEPVGEDRGGGTGARDLAWAGLARRRRAQRRLDDLLIMARNPHQGIRQAQAGPIAARRAGEALQPCRAAADGHVCGRRRRLCADAKRELRTEPAGNGRGPAEQRRMHAARLVIRRRPAGRRSRSSFYRQRHLIRPLIIGHFVRFRFRQRHARRLRRVCARFRVAFLRRRLSRRGARDCENTDLLGPGRLTRTDLRTTLTPPKLRHATIEREILGRCHVQ